MFRVARFAGVGDHAVVNGVLGICASEQHGGLRQRLQIVGLYDELRPSLYGYLICLGLAPQEADDVIQETFLSLFRYLKSGGKTANLRGWIFRVSHNLSVNLQRRERRLVSDAAEEHGRPLREQLDPALSPEEVYLWKEQLKRLEGAVQQLTEQQRQCLHLRAEGLRYREIATVLGVGVSRVPQLLQRAMVRLMNELYG